MNHHHFLIFLDESSSFPYFPVFIIIGGFKNPLYVRIPDSIISDLLLPTSCFRSPLSAIHPPSSILHPPSSAIRPPQSAIRNPSSSSPLQRKIYYQVKALYIVLQCIEIKNFLELSPQYLWTPEEFMVKLAM